MHIGIDTPQNCEKEIDCLKKAGYEFIIRYYNTINPKKNLTLQEARAITASSLQIVVAWENGFPTKAAYFSHSSGVNDSTSAYHYALHEIGQPAGTPIYFAVDYDAAPTEIAGGVRDYFQGIREGFRAMGMNNAAYSIGVYGSGAVCAWLLSQQLVQFCWLAQSRGWRGSKEFKSWNLKQGPASKKCGLDVDTNESTDHYGGFQIEQIL